jgi:hypothetical protein
VKSEETQTTRTPQGRKQQEGLQKDEEQKKKAKGSGKDPSKPLEALGSMEECLMFPPIVHKADCTNRGVC